jgi:dTDP-4-dehydrorhamnose 3,5-epimerase
MAATPIPGCFELRPKVLSDERGAFVKFFQYDAWHRLGLSVDIKEQYYSRSQRNVLRGLHFQRPPAQHAKAVFCVSGHAFDVLLDLRKGSPTFGKCHACHLHGEQANGVYVPEGLAHGFAAMEDDTVLVYLVTSEYSPENDTGVRWDSAGIEWPIGKPIVSDRDRSLTPMVEFVTPFQYRA